MVFPTGIVLSSFQLEMSRKKVGASVGIGIGVGHLE
jgi:hypothetical protein